MDSRGQGWAVDTMPFYVIFVMVVGLLVLAFAFLMQRYVADQFKIPDGLEDELLSQRFFGVHCFGAEDILSGRQLHAIDFTLFTQQRLDECYTLSENSRYFAYRLQLDGIALKTANWKDSYSVQRKRAKEVAILKEGVVKSGILSIEVQHE